MNNNPRLLRRQMRIVARKLVALRFCLAEEIGPRKATREFKEALFQAIAEEKALRNAAGGEYEQ